MSSKLRRFMKHSGGTPFEFEDAPIYYHDKSRDLTIYRLMTVEACRKLGGNSSWCTNCDPVVTADYLRTGKLFLIKKGHKRYQFWIHNPHHIIWNPWLFCNEKNRELKGYRILGRNLLEKMIREVNPDILFASSHLSMWL